MSPIQVSRYLLLAVFAMFALMVGDYLLNNGSLMTHFIYHFVVVAGVVGVYLYYAFMICEDPEVVRPVQRDHNNQIVRRY